MTVRRRPNEAYRADRVGLVARVNHLVLSKALRQLQTFRATPTQLGQAKQRYRPSFIHLLQASRKVSAVILASTHGVKRTSARR